MPRNDNGYWFDVLKPQFQTSLYDFITDALACLDVPNPSAVAQQVSALVGDRLTVQLYSVAEKQGVNE